MSAGAARRALLVTHAPLDPDALRARVADERSGAVSSFLGTVRSPDAGEDVLYLEYEGYEAMIEAELVRIADAVEEDHGLLGLAIAHRLGRCHPGEATIALVACSPHRDAAFAACREALTACKTRLPIWKRQVAADGARWLPGERVPGAVLE